jgi:hypothetical protein
MRRYSVVLFFLIVGIASCDDLKLDKGPTLLQEKIIPQEVGIYIPSALNSDSGVDKKKSINGSEIYNYIRSYIGLADKMTSIVQSSYQRMGVVETSGVLEFFYTDIDGKTKNVSILENYTDTIANKDWDYYMEVYNETFADLALKAWWNVSPHEQKILFKPSSLNTTEMTNHKNALAEIQYKVGSAESQYEEELFVAIVGLTRKNEISDVPENIIISIGKNSNTLDITGASYNPDVALLDFNYRGGRNWTFLAKMNTTENIAAVELALPPSSIETVDNLFTDYSFKQVVLDEIKTVNPGSETLSESELFALEGIDGSLVESPGFYNQSGFVAAGTPPSTSYNILIDFEELTPYVPVFVRDYTIELTSTGAVVEGEN